MIWQVQVTLCFGNLTLALLVGWAKKKKNGAMTWLTLLGKRFSARITSGFTTLFQSSSRGIGVWIVSASVAHNLDLIFLKIV